MNKKEILDEFGRKLVQEVFDRQYKFILNNLEDLAETKGYENLFKDMNETQKKEIEFYTYQRLSGALFDFLRLFEENEEFKLYFEKDGEKVDLVKISENLKAEPIIENGWIQRYSQKLKT